MKILRSRGPFSVWQSRDRNVSYIQTERIVPEIVRRPYLSLSLHGGGPASA
ncbi:Hypothetical protein FKW44_004195 [Caligus rogercresseyi]|uniref:Uncharacterized protein n=1 Tax=Caligus rogercresseyi TaxID=217165 RepID=A0A7T8KAF7_CALRO|nr:Hypothetical protein FKW44_004195 [Caligus rogercresseyi]